MTQSMNTASNTVLQSCTYPAHCGRLQKATTTTAASFNTGRVLQYHHALFLADNYYWLSHHLFALMTSCYRSYLTRVKKLLEVLEGS